MIHRFTCLFVAVSCSWFLTAVCQAENWPRFRGVNGSGVSASVDLPQQLGPDTNVLWQCKMKRGSSSPIVVDGRVYLTAYEGDDRLVQCLDAQTGDQLWIRSLPKVHDEIANRFNGPATCSPVCDGTHLVVFFPDTALVCYSVDGELKWRVDVGPFHSMHGVANSPIIAEDKAIVMVDQLRGSFLAAYDLDHGGLAWKVDRANGLTGGYSTPSLCTLTEARSPLILTSGPGGLTAYELETGKSIFSVPGVANAPVTLPVVLGTRVLLCEPVGEVMPITSMLSQFDDNQDGNISVDEAGKSEPMVRMLERMDRDWGNGDGIVTPAEWNKSFQSFVGNGGLVAVDIESKAEAVEGKIGWNYRKEVPYVATPVAYQGIVYAADDGGIVTLFDQESGEFLDRKRLKRGGRQVYASPVAADGKVYILTTDGKFSVLRAGQEVEELCTVELDEGCLATPAICDGRIYVRTGTRLYCFGKDS